jgi:uncharacterized membrane protein YgcG
MFTKNRVGWSGIGSIAAFAIAGAVACSSSSAPASAAPTVPVPVVDAAVFDAASAPDEGTSSEVTLTVLNFLNWCSVTINGGAASTAATVTASVAQGSTATIVVTPASSAFTIGADPWFGVTQNGGAAAPGTDQGTGATETSTATVVVAGNQCVSVCCELPNNGPPACPTTDPCGSGGGGSSSGGSSSGGSSSGGSSSGGSSGGGVY